MFEDIPDTPPAPRIAGPEAIIGLPIRGRLDTPDGTMHITQDLYAVYLMFHWPWSQHGDLDSHTLYGLN